MNTLLINKNRLCVLLLAGCCAASPVRAATVAATNSAGPPATAFSRALSQSQWKQVEDCVDRTLAYIASQQANDGSFPTLPQGQPAVTALCVLAFLSRGHQPGYGPYGEQLNRAIDFVLSCQTSDGLFSYQDTNAATVFVRGGGGNGATYNHAISGLMLGEVFGHLTPDRNRAVKEAMGKALQFSRALQTRPKENAEDIGGWRYLRLRGPGEADSDLSVTGWHLMFLRSARNAEFNVPQEYIDEAMAYVHRSWDEDVGMFHYTVSGSQTTSYTRGLMGSAIVSLALAGQHESDQARAAGDWLLAHPYTFFGQTYGRSDRFFYSTYYCSQAAAQLGGRYWTGIFPPIAAILVKAQNADGSFPAETQNYNGNIPPQNPFGRGGFGQDARFGSLYSSALAVLSLTPAYQLLPVYQR